MCVYSYYSSLAFFTFFLSLHLLYLLVYVNRAVKVLQLQLHELICDKVTDTAACFQIYLITAAVTKQMWNVLYTTWMVFSMNLIIKQIGMVPIACLCYVHHCSPFNKLCALSAPWPQMCEPAGNNVSLWSKDSVSCLYIFTTDSTTFYQMSCSIQRTRDASEVQEGRPSSSGHMCLVLISDWTFKGTPAVTGSGCFSDIGIR